MDQSQGSPSSRQRTIVYLYGQGHSMRDIAVAIHVPTMTVQRTLRALGVEPRSRGSRRPR